MIKKALEYIVGMSAPVVNDIGGQAYSDKELHRISYNPKAEAITMNTLSSLVQYIRSNIDIYTERMIVHIQSPVLVSFYSALDMERKREVLVKVHADIPDFRFNEFVDHERFCIGVQSKFVTDPDTDKDVLLKFAGTVEAGTVAEYGDDGVTQKATVKTGIASKGEAIVPSPAILKPYRTFYEVEQPASSFIFRMKNDKYDGVKCALYEADGGAWKMDAMRNVFCYLSEMLADIPGITIIF